MKKNVLSLLTLLLVSGLQMVASDAQEEMVSAEQSYVWVSRCPIPQEMTHFIVAAKDGEMTDWKELVRVGEELYLFTAVPSNFSNLSQKFVETNDTSCLDAKEVENLKSFGFMTLAAALSVKESADKESADKELAEGS
jgi:hypothetical protein